MELTHLIEEHEDLLFKIPLFQDLPMDVKKSLLDRLDYSFYEVKKNEVILRQNKICKHLYILLKGKLRVDIIDAMGNEILIEHIIAPRAFATPHLFKKDAILPATFTVIEDGLFFKATKESVFSLISNHPEILKSFLCVVGNCTKCTVVRLRALSYKNIRSRFIAYLFEQERLDRDIVNMEHNQVQLADYLCVTRPALSKEINKMVKEDLIQIKGKKVQLQDIPKLEQLLL